MEDTADVYLTTSDYEKILQVN